MFFPLERLLVLSDDLAENLWRRVSPMMNRDDILRVRPIGFGNGGIWKPVRLNECFKFGRYQEGTFFSPHIDGPWVPRDDER